MTKRVALALVLALLTFAPVATAEGFENPLAGVGEWIQSILAMVTGSGNGQGGGTGSGGDGGDGEMGGEIDPSGDPVPASGNGGGEMGGEIDPSG